MTTPRIDASVDLAEHAEEFNRAGRDNRTRLIPMPAQSSTVPSVFSDAASFETGQRMARALAESDMVPPQYQNKIGNCLILLDMARRMGMTPFHVARTLNVIHGRPTWSSEFVISAINSCGLFSPLRFEWEGARGSDEWGCRATAKDLATGETLRGSLVTIGLAKREGWYARTGSKWQTMPEQMLMYRAGAFFGRIYAGHILNGMGTTEEAHDAPRDVTAAGSAEVVAPAAAPDTPVAALNERVRTRRRQREEAAPVVTVVDEVLPMTDAEVAASANNAARGDSVEDIF